MLSGLVEKLRFIVKCVFDKFPIFEMYKIFLSGHEDKICRGAASNVNSSPDTGSNMSQSQHHKHRTQTANRHAAVSRQCLWQETISTSYQSPVRKYNIPNYSC